MKQLEPLRILMVFDPISKIGGGSQIVLFLWLKNLTKLGIDIRLLCNDTAFVPSEILPEEKIIRCPSISINAIYPDFSVILKLNKDTLDKIRRFSPQIIHSHEPSLLSFYTLHYAHKNHIPFLSSYHTNYKLSKVEKFPLSLFLTGNNGLFNIIGQKWQYFFLKNASAITVPTVHYQQEVENKLKKKSFVSPYPISSDFFSNDKPVPPKVEKLIAISRLSGEKNINILIDCMKYLPSHITLTIVGDGIDRDFLEKQVRQMNLKDRVTFIGWVNHDQVHSLLKNHHLFVSPSSFETFGITYIEALGLGIPCVVYDYSVTREVIPENCALYVSDLLPSNWAKIITKATDYQVYLQLVNNINRSYNQIKKYNEVQSTQELINIYTKIMQKKSL